MKKYLIGSILLLSSIPTAIGMLYHPTKNDNYEHNKELRRSSFNPKAEPKAKGNLDELRAKTPEEIAKWTKFDTRDYNLVTKVEDQGKEGICWSFSIAAASEVNMLYKEGTLDPKWNNTNLILAKKNIDDLSTKRSGKDDVLGLTNDDTKNTQAGLGSLDTFSSAILLMQQNGPVYGQNLSTSGPKMAWLESIINLPNNVEIIKKAVAKYGAVSFALRHSDIKNNSLYSQSNQFTHVATIVGWDDNYSRNKFLDNKPTQNGAWIVKNSWGPQAYDNGYFYTSYESVMENIVTFDYVNRNTYNDLYYYDGLGRLQFSNKQIGKKKISAIYPVKRASYNVEEKLKGVSFALKGKNVKVRAQVYKNVEANPADRFSQINKPTSGVLVHEELSPVYENPEEYRGGIYTMRFNKEITLEAGQYFSVVLEVINDNQNGEFMFSSEPNSTNDLTYYEKEPGVWENCATDEHYLVASIKALTTSEKKVGDSNNDLKYAKVTNKTLSLPYSNNDLSPNLEVLFDNKPLKQNQDFQITNEKIVDTAHVHHKENSDVGTLVTTIKGIGKYRGEQKIYTKLLKKDKPDISGLQFAQWENNNISFNVKDSFTNKINTYADLTLPQGWIFENPNLSINQSNRIIYNNDVDKECFSNTQFAVNVKITKVTHEITDSNITIAGLPNEIAYTGSAIQPELNLTLSGKSLTKDSDYIISYQNNLNVGIANIEIIGLEYFSGKRTLSFKIKKGVNSFGTWITHGNEQPTIDPKWGNTYYKYFKDPQGQTPLEQKPTTAGTYYVQAFVNGTQNYDQIQSEIFKWVILSDAELAKLNIGSDWFKVSVLNPESIKFNQSEQKPEIKLIDSTGNVLKKGTDYELKYENNINAGQGKIIITAKGKYVGNKILHFTITKGTNKVSLKFENNQLIPSATFGTPVIKYYSDAAGTKEINKPTNAGTYYAKAYVPGTNNYDEAWSAVVEYAIQNQQPPITPDPSPQPETNSSSTTIILASIFSSLGFIGLVILGIWLFKKYKKH